MVITGYGSRYMIGWLLSGVNENWKEGDQLRQDMGRRVLEQHV
jgi:hypothetical protein